MTKKRPRPKRRYLSPGRRAKATLVRLLREFLARPLTAIGEERR